MRANTALKQNSTNSCYAAAATNCNCAVPVCALSDFRAQRRNSFALLRKEEECCNRATD